MPTDNQLYPESAAEVHVVVSELFTRLQVALLSWPPDSAKDLAQLVQDVVSAGERLGKLGAIKPKSARTRRRWAAAETPPTVDPPSFPGPRRQRKKVD